jgi:hypothetical protein
MDKTENKAFFEKQFADFIAESKEIMQTEKSKEIMESIGVSEKQLETFLETEMHEQMNKICQLVLMLRDAFDAKVSEQEAKIIECQSLFLTLHPFHQTSFLEMLITSDFGDSSEADAWRGACCIRFIWAMKK